MPWLAQCTMRFAIVCDLPVPGGALQHEARAGARRGDRGELARVGVERREHVGDRAPRAASAARDAAPRASHASRPPAREQLVAARARGRATASNRANENAPSRAARSTRQPGRASARRRRRRRAARRDRGRRRRREHELVVARAAARSERVVERAARDRPPRPAAARRRVALELDRPQHERRRVRAPDRVAPGQQAEREPQHVHRRRRRASRAARRRSSRAGARAPPPPARRAAARSRAPARAGLERERRRPQRARTRAAPDRVGDRDRRRSPTSSSGSRRIEQRQLPAFEARTRGRVDHEASLSRTAASAPRKRPDPRSRAPNQCTMDTMTRQSIEIPALARCRGSRGSRSARARARRAATRSARPTSSQRIEQPPLPYARDRAGDRRRRRRPVRARPGQVTDDTQLAVCIARSLRASAEPRSTSSDIARALRRVVPSTRSTSATRPARARAGSRPANRRRPRASTCGATSGRRAAGNGSLMRTAPIGVALARHTSISIVDARDRRLADHARRSALRARVRRVRRAIAHRDRATAARSARSRRSAPLLDAAARRCARSGATTDDLAALAPADADLERDLDRRRRASPASTA